MHLCQMLGSLRNRKCIESGDYCDKHYLEGLYFPKNEAVDCILKVTVDWVNERLHFVESQQVVLRII